MTLSWDCLNWHGLPKWLKPMHQATYPCPRIFAGKSNLSCLKRLQIGLPLTETERCVIHDHIIILPHHIVFATQSPNTVNDVNVIFHFVPGQRMIRISFSVSDVQNMWTFVIICNVVRMHNCTAASSFALPKDICVATWWITDCPKPQIKYWHHSSWCNSCLVFPD